MTRKTPISLDSNIEDFINSNEGTRIYSTEGEDLHLILKQLKSDVRNLRKTRNALIKGENSPMVESFDAEKHLADLHNKHL